MKIMVCIQTKIKLCSKKYTFCTIVFYIHVNVINKINEINYIKHFCYKRYNCNIIKKKFISKLKAAKLSLIFIYVSRYVPVAQWLEHRVSSAKVVGSIPREHTY